MADTPYELDFLVKNAALQNAVDFCSKKDAYTTAEDVVAHAKVYERYLKGDV